MGSNSCFSEIIADVFPPWHRVNTQLDAAEQQTAAAHTDWWLTNQLIIDQQPLAATYPLNSCGSSKGWLSFCSITDDQDHLDAWNLKIKGFGNFTFHTTVFPASLFISPRVPAWPEGRVQQKLFTFCNPAASCCLHHHTFGMQNIWLGCNRSLAEFKNVFMLGRTDVFAIFQKRTKTALVAFFCFPLNSLDCVPGWPRASRLPSGFKLWTKRQGKI